MRSNGALMSLGSKSEDPVYTIIDMGNGEFRCEGKLQDSIERWTKHSLEEAVQSMKTFAEVGNGEKKLKKKHITFLRPIQVVKTEYERFYPYGKKGK